MKLKLKKIADTVFYNIKNKNEFLINFQQSKISTLNSKNFNIKKDFDFDLYGILSTVCLINDNFFLLSDYNSKKRKIIFI